jgi:hypothetical protein
MIDLETAKKLKDAGLIWKENAGDWYKVDNYSKRLLGYYEKISPVVRVQAVWLPRLDQLLTEIEGRGYGYNLYSVGTPDEIACDFELLYWDAQDRCWETEGRFVCNVTDSPEEAVAAALLWVIEHEGAKG